MELYEDILVNYLLENHLKPTIHNLGIDAKAIVELTCYKALQQIKAVLEDDSLEDKDCFMRIEEIVCIFEKMGSNGGCRHDFG